MTYKCEICNTECETQDYADTCCVLCDYCGLYYFAWEINENGWCESCAEFEEETND